MCDAHKFGAESWQKFAREKGIRPHLRFKLCLLSAGGRIDPGDRLMVRYARKCTLFDSHLPPEIGGPPAEESASEDVEDSD